MDAYPPSSGKKKETVEVPKKVINDILASYHGLETGLETLEVLSKPELLEDIEESRRDIAAGRLHDLAAFKEIVG